ncbi:3',5'-cyclic AMP phosphodiesterase CpdA [Chitinophaga jiangningensis]|uniref:3',5'-cyclic AMP phosphodiesterase CpdA n=1 Tax=Chitinophaga jiangningensis TaxID=1419482 RepID=A0A1M7CLS8_9BACT|nr:metallophosphoesterase [Chitinophaga jiangningensis]SHL68132.1 3',5'-cyclic AMP phosphodiesterase CpdA [Chitinophaga jiangningensis]
MILNNSTGFRSGRRAFIRNAAAALMTMAIPDAVLAAYGPKLKTLSLGLITDLHHDIMHDAQDRLNVFLDAMKAARPNALLQLGDFAYPSEKNKPLINKFNQAHPIPLHVIGNHDNDNGFSHQQCVEVWKMPATYYSKVINGYKLIVLNGNEKGSPTHKGGYPAYVGPDQTNWLKKELAASRQPVIVICHQPLVGYGSLDNAAEIQQILTSAKHKVVMTINGHTHVDRLDYVGDIPYLTINSASYFWVGGHFKHDSFTPEIHKAHPYICYTCPYDQSLFTLLKIDPVKKVITLSGNQAKWVGKSPEELGFNEQKPFEAGKDIVPFIRDRSIPMGNIKL